MIKNFRYRKKTVLTFVGVIVLCLLAELILMNNNRMALQRSIEVQKEAEVLKVNTVEIIKNVHLLDLGLRGYALDKNKMMKSPMDTAMVHKTRIFQRVHKSLSFLGYPLHDLKQMEETTNNYFNYIIYLKNLIDQGQQQEFLNDFAEDRGYRVYLEHLAFSKKVNLFADTISRTAKSDYEEAEQNIYLLQIIVFCIVVPTLLYTAYFSNKTVALAEKLKDSEEQKATLLAGQNEKLERAVHDRTQEILAQNEEIKAQNEEIVSHNDHLLLQQNQIEKQAAQLLEKNEQLERVKESISSKNISLSSELERQNHNLSSANKELLEQNERLEQFAYIISHNLRAPIARLIGLTSIANTQDPEDVRKVFGMIKHSSQELDTIVKDLTSILSIQRLSPTLYSHINLSELIIKLRTIFSKEISETFAVIDTKFATEKVFSLSAYIESIFLNLISNSLKYRHPERDLKITISSANVNGDIRLVFSDNGIGIDLEKHGRNIFNLYKRFHFHVEGKGIGLFLVKTQVDALGGNITVNSQIDHGTTFEILLKAVPDKARS